MTKEAALFQFFNQFLPAYPSSSVPDDVTFPYLTYTPVVDSWSGGEVSITVNLWFYTELEAEPNRKADELSKGIGYGGTMLPCDGGFVWLKRGSPWCQSLQDDTAPTIKRRYINVTAEYLTKD